MDLEQFGIDRLSPQQRVELIDLLWDSLPDDAPFTPPAWHLRELERRVAAADADPAAAEPWEAVLARLSQGGKRGADDERTAVPQRLG